MNFHCSMVVDQAPLHPYQADILLHTLDTLGQIPRSRVLVQCTSRTPDSVVAAISERGYQTPILTPYLDQTFCNKIAQLDHLVEQPPSGAGVFLLDLDLAVTAPLEAPDPDRIRGKVVDGPNPPLPVIKKLFADLDQPLPACVPCDLAHQGDTIASNLNGGFLFVPTRLIAPLRQAWRHWAETMFHNPDLCPHPVARKHIDQLAFALALGSANLPWASLPTNWNYPCHQPGKLSRLEAEQPVRVLHYHRCLDEFGFIAPKADANPALAAAVQRANSSLGKRTDTEFFGHYKKHLATEVLADAVPATTTPVAASDGKRTRLILHAGTPKTGCIALQTCLYKHRDRLAEHGWWYPEPSDGQQPKHQRLVELLRYADGRGLTEHVLDLAQTAPSGADNLMLSTEGIFNHWQDFSRTAKAEIRQLGEQFDVELCVWLREPASFAAALYGQYLRNPQAADQEAPEAAVYGRPISFQQALQNPWFRQHLDYLLFVQEAGLLLGEDRVRVFRYCGDTPGDFLRHYAVPLRADEQRRINRSSSRAGQTLTRFANHLPPAWRQNVGHMIRRADLALPWVRRPAPLREAEAAEVMRYAGRGWRHLETMFVNR